MKRLVFFYLIIFMLDCSCSVDNKEIAEGPDNDAELKHYTDSLQSARNFVFEDKPYDVAMFTYMLKDDPDLRLRDLCPVLYYAKDGILYTSEKYYVLQLSYSQDSDSTLSYTYLVFFDRTQEPNADGWYSLDLKDKDIPRIPSTHLSAITLGSYYGGLFTDYSSNCVRSRSLGYLYNICNQISEGREMNTLNDNLENILPYIK